jgi:RHS repeat-associated protein
VEEQWYDRDGEVVRREVNGERVLTVEIGAHRRAFTDALWRQSVREYDDWDNLIAVTYPDGTGERYRVSPADSSRLERIDARGIRTRYDYDARGNRLSAAHTEGPWEYNAANQLEGYPGASYHYDANGNTTEKTEAGLTTRYGYDAEDRLREVRDENANLLARYAYDPFGRRLAKTRDGTTTYFLYADEGLIAELDAAGTVQQAYGWAPDSLWGTEPLYTEANGERGFYLTDHLGTPHKLIAPNGATLWAATYHAFGQAEVDPASRLANPLRFPGQYFDPETGLHYNYFRDYEPSTGRYVESDPIGLGGGLNTFAYAGNNPTRFVDPTGQFFFIPLVLAACTGGGCQAVVVGSIALLGGAIWWSQQQSNIQYSDAGEDNVIPFPGSDAGTQEDEGEQCPLNEPDGGCLDWKMRLLALSENIQMLESITGKINERRAEYTASARAYNRICGNKTGRIPEIIFTVFD